MEKFFRITCRGCGWAELSTGLSADLSHLIEIKKCPTCGKVRSFKCLRCGGTANMVRIRGNS